MKDHIKIVFHVDKATQRATVETVIKTLWEQN